MTSEGLVEFNQIEFGLVDVNQMIEIDNKTPHVIYNYWIEFLELIVI